MTTSIQSAFPADCLEGALSAPHLEHMIESGALGLEPKGDLFGAARLSEHPVVNSDFHSLVVEHLAKRTDRWMLISAEQNLRQISFPSKRAGGFHDKGRPISEAAGQQDAIRPNADRNDVCGSAEAIPIELNEPVTHNFCGLRGSRPGSQDHGRQRGARDETTSPHRARPPSHNDPSSSDVRDGSKKMDRGHSARVVRLAQPQMAVAVVAAATLCGLANVLALGARLWG